MIPWSDYATRMGYPSTGTMLEELYKENSIQDLATRFQVSHYAMRQALIRHNVELKKRGGTTTTPSGKLDEVTEEEYRAKGAAQLATEHSMDISAVYKAMRRRGISAKPTELGEVPTPSSTLCQSPHPTQPSSPPSSSELPRTSESADESSQGSGSPPSGQWDRSTR